MKHSNSNKEKNSIEFRTYRPHIVHGIKQNKTRRSRRFPNRCAAKQKEIIE